MLRGGPQHKQKKRLSFKEPEIEGPATPNPIVKNNLSLEDQALHIAQSVGSAFSELSCSDYRHANLSDTLGEKEDIQAGAFATDYCYPSEENPYRRNFYHFATAINEPEPTPTMRCPLTENHVFEEKNPSHQVQLLRYQLEQQNQQTQLALHQVQLLTGQLEAESTARKKAQEQNNQLMAQNQELLNHIEKLFQQIEDLEKQIQMRGMEKRAYCPQNMQSQQQRSPPSYATNRRLSSDSIPNKLSRPIQKKSTSIIRQQHYPSQIIKPSINTNAPVVPIRRTSTGSVQPNKLPYNSKDMSLHIGDISPPVVHGGTMSPFSSGWQLKDSETDSRSRTGSFSFSKLKLSEHFSAQGGKITINTEASSGSDQEQSGKGFGSISRFKPMEHFTSESGELNVSPGRLEPEAKARTTNFGAFSKLKPPEHFFSKDSAGVSAKDGTANRTVGKKYSSTSDLYSSAASRIVIEDSKSAGPSKLPRFQAYTGGRRSSLSKEFVDQFTVFGKDKFKTAPQTSFMKR